MRRAEALHPRKAGGAAAGFTLLEVMVALAVFSVGLLAIFSMHVSAMRTNNVARGVTENITAAAAKAEQLMALAYDDPQLAAGWHEPEQEEDGIDNDLDGSIDEDGERGHLRLRWFVEEECLGVDFQGHKCLRLEVRSVVNASKTKEIRLNFIKTEKL
ncbi:MAG: prepilin-type N-terminal cleavage/methylation domain-containing protein [Desulfobacterales bacterium]